mgnify:CR=1 FL=1
MNKNGKNSRTSYKTPKNVARSILAQTYFSSTIGKIECSQIFYIPSP